MKYFLGLDLGQANDYTALALLEKIPQWKEVEYVASDRGVHYKATRKEARPAHYVCRHLERVKRGTQYPVIVRSVRDFLADPVLKGETELVLDATGCGRPVRDMFVAGGLNPVAVTIHGGDTVTRDGLDFRVPKRDLVGAALVLLQSDRLGIPTASPETAILEQELINFKVKIDPLTAHDSYAAWRDGDHDDLVLAVAVAAWYAEREQPTRFRPASSHSFMWP